MKNVCAFDVEDLSVDVLPGGASEPVLHVPVVVAVVVLVWSSPAN